MKFYRFNSIKLCSLILLAIVTGCGGSNSNIEDLSVNGTWDSTYNVILTEDIIPCNSLGSESITTIIDTQEITQTENGYSLYSPSLELETESTLIEEKKITFLDSYSGDIYDDGTYCEAKVTINYNNIINGTADTMLHYVIRCNDGFECEDRAVGTSTRRLGTN